MTLGIETDTSMQVCTPLI